MPIVVKDDVWYPTNAFFGIFLKAYSAAGKLADTTQEDAADNALNDITK